MANKKEHFTIKDSELANWFSIKLQRLDEIIDFFDADPHDEWELVETKDYIYINKIQKVRYFSAQGALKIAAYLDENEKRGLFYKIRDFITQHDARIRQSIARKVIIEELADNGKIILVNNIPMIHKQSLRRILETNGWKLKQTLESLQKSDLPLQLGEDYTEIDRQDWFAGSVVVRVSKEMSETLTNKSRRKACEYVYIEFPKTFKALSQPLLEREKAIQQAKDKAKRRDKKTCQITNRQPSKYDKFNLAVHHLYCSHKYPHLATLDINLITIAEDIHQEFHGSLGGFDKPCTLEDFIEFVHHHYPEHNPELMVKLQQTKKVLEKG